MTTKERNAREDAILDHMRNVTTARVREYRQVWLLFGEQPIEDRLVSLAARLMAERDFLKRELQAARAEITRLRKRVQA